MCGIAGQIDYDQNLQTQVETLKQLIKKLKTPTLMDSVIFEAVVEQAAPCLKGDITPETAAGEVMKKVNLY